MTDFWPTVYYINQNHLQRNLSLFAAGHRLRADHGGLSRGSTFNWRPQEGGDPPRWNRSPLERARWRHRLIYSWNIVLNMSMMSSCRADGERDREQLDVVFVCWLRNVIGNDVLRNVLPHNQPRVSREGHWRDRLGCRQTSERHNYCIRLTDRLNVH